MKHKYLEQMKSSLKQITIDQVKATLLERAAEQKKIELHINKTM
jgi:hypothetical protein